MNVHSKILEFEARARSELGCLALSIDQFCLWAITSIAIKIRIYGKITQKLIVGSGQKVTISPLYLHNSEIWQWSQFTTPLKTPVFCEGANKLDL